MKSVPSGYYSSPSHKQIFSIQETWFYLKCRQVKDWKLNNDNITKILK